MHLGVRLPRTSNYLCYLAVLGAGAFFSVAAVACCQQQSALAAVGTPAKDIGGSQQAPPLQQRPRYRVEPGDVLDLNFPLSPEFNQTVKVAPDGYVTLKNVGDFLASGKDLPHLTAALKIAYAPILHNPVITAELKDFQKPYFVVGGEVGHPGKFDLRENTSVTEALEIAGGLTQASKHSQVLLFRRVGDGTFVEARKLNVKKMLKSGDLAEDMYLRPGDMLFVPKNTISKIERFIPTSSLGIYSNGLP
jgi:polysaccharide biosynthesis/export protein